MNGNENETRVEEIFFACGRRRMGIIARKYDIKSQLEYYLYLCNPIKRTPTVLFHIPYFYFSFPTHSSYLNNFFFSFNFDEHTAHNSSFEFK